MECAKGGSVQKRRGVQKPVEVQKREGVQRREGGGSKIEWR